MSIALEHRGVPTQAVVYDPGKNELFTASRGRGAFLDDRRMRVSKCTQLKDALVGTGFPFKEVSRLDLYMRQLRTMMTSSAGVRRAGAAALDLAYVAAGRLDAFWEMGLSRWDMAAGALLIQEAGGLVGGPAGRARIFSTAARSPRRRRRCCRSCSKRCAEEFVACLGLRGAAGAQQQGEKPGPSPHPPSAIPWPPRSRRRRGY